MDYILYLITAGAIIISILVIVISVKLYGVNEMKNKVHLMEQEAMKRIKTSEDDLSRRNAEFNERIDKFNKEEKLRESLEDKTDREVIVELHVKVSNMLASLEFIDNKLEGVKGYSKQLQSFENRVISSVQNSIATLEEEIHDEFSDMDSKIKAVVSDNVVTIDESDIRSAVSDALNYDSYSFKSSLEDTITSAIDNKFSDIDWKLSNIESKLNL
jgi:vacuolar-type H+-ATPase subunit I/STV1